MEIEEEQKKIIEKDLKEKVIINAPPGSGKTETIIQKLAYICKNELADSKDILVICFSRAAVKEIKQRVEKITGIRNKIDIRTIDSFCSWVIREIEDNYKEKFTKMNYEERIQYVINLLEKDNRLRIQVKCLKHIIIDEFQDIVGVRANFILKLLEVHEGGFTILGDEYQAIFNYQSDSMTSEELIEKTQKRYPNCQYIEYETQHRENDDRQKAKNNIFRIIIKRNKNNPVQLNNYMEKIIIPNIKEKSLKNIKDKKVAILTRQNGEAYEIIKTLDEKIPYQIQQYNNIITFPTWIGFTLFDYDRTYITKEKFKNIIADKLGVDDTEKYWEYCKEIENLDKIYNEDEYELDLSIFKENIIIDKGAYPRNFEKENNSLIISTIHKSKGREYDEVYIHFKEKDFIQKKKPELALDNARVLYVALTRAKNQYYKYEKEIKNIFFESFKDRSQDRYYGFIKQGYKSFKNIKKIEMGLDGDVDNNSFIDENIVGNVEECQKYIYNNVKKGDTVDLIREGEKFYIYHKNRKIGMVNIEDIFKKVIYRANRWKYYEKEVVAYRGVNVKNIITIAKFSDFIEDKYASPYKDTGLWIGIELEGFGNIEFEG